MIGVVLITHGRLGHELKLAVENMLGDQTQMECVSVTPGATLESMRDTMNQAAQSVSNGGEGVLILSDIFGGTPCNLAASIASTDDVMVLTGVNLPMLVAVARARKRSDLAQVAQAGLEAGRHYIGFAEAPKESSKKAAQWSKS